MADDSNSSKAVKAGIGYTIGNVLVRGIGFLTLPVFSRIMTTEEFGIYNVFLSYENLLFVIVGFAMHTSLQSANLNFKGEINSYTSSISLIYLINFFSLIGASLIFGSSVSRFLNVDEPMIIMLVIYSSSSALFSLYNDRLSIDYSYKKYLIVSLAHSLGNIFLSLIFIVTIFESKREYGRILGGTISVAAAAVYILFCFYKKARPKINKKYWIFGLKYSLPIVPHGISQVLLEQVDRIMIRTFVGDAEVGIYSLAGNIKLILIVITESIAFAWKTWVFSEVDRGNKQNIQSAATQICGLYVIFTVCLMAVVPELIFILGGKAYNQAGHVAIPLIMDAFILFLYNIVVQGEYYAKKTVYIMVGTIFATVVDLITNYIFIQKYGFIAAAYTTLFSYVCYLLLHLMISHRILHFSILPVKWLLLYSAIVCMSAGINLYYMPRRLLRWLLCAIFVIPMLVILMKTSGYDKIIMKELNFKNKKRF